MLNGYNRLMIDIIMMSSKDNKKRNGKKNKLGKMKSIKKSLIKKSKKEIKKAYRLLARIYHPDLALINKKEAEEIFKKINNAYENLN